MAVCEADEGVVHLCVGGAATSSGDIAAGVAQLWGTARDGAAELGIGLEAGICPATFWNCGGTDDGGTANAGVALERFEVPLETGRVGMEDSFMMPCDVR
jgi:hypothetical protein